jgi:two-component system, NarL family, sensor histidine kinase DevS
MEWELLEFAPDAVVGIDSSGRIVLANSRTADVFGYTRDELLGEMVEVLVPQSARAVHVGHREHYFEHPRTRPMGEGLDLRARRRDGSEFPCEISLSSVHRGGERIALAAVRDATERKREQVELRTAVKRLQAAADVALAVGGETELGGVLQAIVERGRALVDARGLVILLQHGDELSVAATSGSLDAEVDGLRFPSATKMREILRSRLAAPWPSDERPVATLLAPLSFRGQQIGLVVALDRLSDDGGFEDEDQRLLEAFAASAATAVATAQSMAEDRLSNTIQAAEHERGRWARELHDETLQGLAALRVRLSAALSKDSPSELELAGRDAVSQIEVEIEKLRGLITELRPAALDEIGLEAAIRALAERSAAQGLSVETRLSLSPTDLVAPCPIDTTVYRLVQEGLTNVVKHGGAKRVLLEVIEEEGRLTVRIQDDGVGFEPGIRPEGFGIRGMRERVNLAGGRLQLDSAPGAGTTVAATLVLPEASEPGGDDDGERRFAPDSTD